MPIRYRLKQFFTALIVLLCAYASINNFIGTFESGEVDFDHVANWENRFTPIKDLLPIQRGTLGYIADWDIPGADFDPSDQDAEYILTQYALSPFVLVRGENHEWIVGSLTPNTYKQWVEIRTGQYEDVKLKGNAYLFHRIK